MRFLVPFVALVLAGAASAQCPNGQCAAARPAGLTIQVWQPPAPSVVYMPSVPVQVIPRATIVEQPVAVLMPARMTAAPAQRVEYRYGPFGRLRRVVVN